MVRRRKSDDDESTNERIGDVLARLRKERGWTLQHVAISLGLSVAHVSALESGQYTFSASLVEKLVKLFQRPLSAFLAEAVVPDTLAAEQRRTLDALSERDRWILLELSRRMAAWGGAPRRAPTETATPGRRGFLVALEGIDGDHLYKLGCWLKSFGRRGSVVHCPHDYKSTLWHYIMECSVRLGHARSDQRALERTLLFACERLLRNESVAEPALRKGKTVLAPFFAVAPFIYQEAEGFSDRRVVDMVEALLPKPDVVLMLRSDPVVAARKAVAYEPGPGQFYSPYSRDELIRAAHLHERATEELQARGVAVHVFDAPDPLPLSVLDSACQKLGGYLPSKPRHFDRQKQ